MNILVGIYESLFRRWWGGWYFAGDENSWWNKRWFKTSINILIIFLALLFLGLDWWKCSIIAIIIQTLEISKGCGMQQDFGHSGYPSDEDIQRYKKQWGYKLLCMLFPVDLWYTYWFDSCLMYIRYTLPLIVLIPLTNWFFPLFGLIGVVFGYQLGWLLQDKGFKFLNNSFCGSATNFGELMLGFSLGFGLILCI